MNRAIYAKYLSDLAANEKVEFPSRKEMIEFFSMMMGEIYKMYLNASAAIPSAEKTIRLSGEPELITFLAKEKLENLVPSSNSTVLFLKKKMGLKLRKLRLSTKASENAFYDLQWSLLKLVESVCVDDENKYIQLINSCPSQEWRDTLNARYANYKRHKG